MLTVVALALGCASGDESSTLTSTFGGSSPPATTMTPSGESTSGSPSATESPAETGDDPTSGDDSSEEPNTTSTTGPGSETDSSSESGSVTAGPGPSEQPEEGMYSSCVSVLDCIGLTACLALTDTSGQPIDSFCTTGSCMSPLAQCDPTPAGTAVPICLPVATEDLTDTVCALDCSLGQLCPEGMDCRMIEGGAICS